MSQWRLGFKLLRREGFSGELRWFVLALALSVACVLSVALVADRLDAGLKASGRDFIGGDRVLRSATPALTAGFLSSSPSASWCFCRWSIL